MSKTDYYFNEKVSVPMDKVYQFEKELYLAPGMNEADADSVAEHLTEADARGVYTHGIQRNGIYLERFQRGGTSIDGRPEIVKQFGGTALVDGKNAMGMVVGNYSMDLAVKLAKEHSTWAVSITGSNHFGTCVHYLNMAAEAVMQNRF